MFNTSLVKIKKKLQIFWTIWIMNVVNKSWGINPKSVEKHKFEKLTLKFYQELLHSYLTYIINDEAEIIA